MSDRIESEGGCFSLLLFFNLVLCECITYLKLKLK